MSRAVACASSELLGRVDTYPLLFFSSLVLPPHSGILPGTPFLDGNACQTTLSLGHLAAEDWLHGILPWWNPYTGVGLPLASEMQPAAFFLPFILLLHFHSGVLLIKLAMQMLAGLACFGFLRQVGVARGPAVLGSVLFQCNGTFAWYADAPMLPIAFLPLLLLGLERARTDASADRRGGEAMIALAIAFSLLAGHPEVALLDGLLGLAWAAFRIRGLSRRCGVAFIWKMAAGGLAGLALAAPVLIPFLQDLRVSTLGFPRSPADTHCSRNTSPPCSFRTSTVRHVPIGISGSGPKPGVTSARQRPSSPCSPCSSAVLHRISSAAPDGCSRSGFSSGWQRPSGRRG